MALSVVTQPSVVPAIVAAPSAAVLEEFKPSFGPTVLARLFYEQCNKGY